MCTVNVTGGTLPQKEINAYIARGAELYGREPDVIDVRVDGEYVELAYHYQQQPFHRIRRITGYLVGTLDRFNNAKRIQQEPQRSRRRELRFRQRCIKMRIHKTGRRNTRLSCLSLSFRDEVTARRCRA